MITDLQALKIKAAAYDRICNSWAGQPQSWMDLGQVAATVRAETTELLAHKSLDVQELNDRLTRSRMSRLLSTQFVYCPDDQVPRIERQKPGDEWFLRENTLTLELEGTTIFDAFEQLAYAERQQFDTKDECVVFWRGAQPWSVASVVDQDRLTASMTYYVCWRYDGEVWTDPRHTPKTKIINLHTHHVDGTPRYPNENQNRWTGLVLQPKELP